MAARKQKESAASRARAAIAEALRGKDLTSGELEELVRAAIDILNRDYWDDVRGVTSDLIRQIKDGEITSESDLYERLDEDVDNTQRIIYTFQAKCGLLSTNNEDAYEDEIGEKPPSIEAQMSMAMRADVRAQLEAKDVDELLRKARRGDEDED